MVIVMSWWSSWSLVIFLFIAQSFCPLLLSATNFICGFPIFLLDSLSTVSSPWQWWESLSFFSKSSSAHSKKLQLLFICKISKSLTIHLKFKKEKREEPNSKNTYSLVWASPKLLPKIFLAIRCEQHNNITSTQSLSCKRCGIFAWGCHSSFSFSAPCNFSRARIEGDVKMRGRRWKEGKRVGHMVSHVAH